MPIGMTVNSKQSAQECGKWITELFDKHHWLKVTISTSKRSLDSNSLSHVWYGEIAKFSGLTEAQAKDYCKLTFGVPILRQYKKANNYFIAIGFDDFDYPRQLASMKYLSVTSLFDVPQMNEYLTAIQNFYGSEGLQLERRKNVES